ncbi:BZ3500_MvSof-1268-A1-R1_Chr8-1g09908 [Microbotryum saponariae]|uniref:BZ3500_MvSof-1268-A1-R1_Chr8-1g09908 protein n=1 Tax=Microbotryum saponariae TaxID=289078 RepID=A0A2X0KVR6_9BASI|nr:BZ3500_MvSof-1268-A1-R1_Chr8-1g09908 [Microbotryum saponariae]SDA08194.1 BZ3501_MvSof-1269-A2-R1_Chr8-1g09631 [Microbotryum saponariae]
MFLLSVACAAVATTLAMVTNEPTLSVTMDLAARLITCVPGLSNAPGGTVLLVHGTGSKGSESWASGPYVRVLPITGKRYKPCYIDLPNRSIGDAQLTAEYVVAAIKFLAPRSSTKKVAVIGHSQGAGLNIPWALQFWPSTQALVSSFIALAGDFHGTTTSVLLCGTAVSFCAASVKQQTKGSRYLAAQNSAAMGSARSALVPTTSIFTRLDDVIQPEGPTNAEATSFLPGASNFALQDATICGSIHYANHVAMLTDSAAFGLAKAALENPTAPVFDRSYCSHIRESPASSFTGLGGLLSGGMADMLAIARSSVEGIRAEPALKSYVCERGFATQCAD